MRPTATAVFACGVLAIVALVAAPLSTVSAQSPPKRPTLAAGADTNSARAYYARGVDLLTQDAWTAAAARQPRSGAGGYRAFLARASAHDRLRSIAAERVTALTY